MILFFSLMNDFDIDSRIMKMTGLDRHETKFYKLFCESADCVTKLVISDSVKDDLADIVEGEYDVETSSWDNSIEEEYTKWLKLFKTKGLLVEPCKDNFDEEITILQGYTPYDDPDIYIPYRKIGTQNWSHRVLKFNLSNHKESFINKGYEFKLD